MTYLEPIMLQALHAAMPPKEKPVDNIPCRVSADLARHEADLRDHIPEAFDDADEEHVAQVVGREIAPEVLRLLATRRSIYTAAQSFGADPAKAMAWCIGDLDRLYDKCRELWRNL